MNNSRSQIAPTQQPYGNRWQNVRGMGGGVPVASEFEYADCAGTANQALTGTPTLDGVATSGKRVLLKNQTTPAQNGVYDVSSAGVWSLVGQPKIVAVINGTTQGKTFFMLTAVNTYSGGCAYYG